MQSNIQSVEKKSDIFFGFLDLCLLPPFKLGITAWRQRGREIFHDNPDDDPEFKNKYVTIFLAVNISRAPWRPVHLTRAIY